MTVSEKSSHSFLWIIVIGILAIAGITIVVKDKPKPQKKAEMIEYYQWNADDGKTMISTTKPKGVPDVIVFRGTPDLMSSEHFVDREILEKGQQAYQSIRNQYQQKQDSEQGPATLVQENQSILSQVEAAEKAIACMELSQQIRSQEMERITTREISDIEKGDSQLRKLRDRHFKECR